MSNGIHGNSLIMNKKAPLIGFILLVFEGFVNPVRDYFLLS